MRISVLRADITKVHADAIVNPANSFGTMGGGVALAIKTEGGAEIEKEAMQHAPIPIGKAVATTAGALRAKYVLHVPTMRTPGRTTLENVRLATRAALTLAEKMKMQSLAFPGMGTGVGGIAPKDAARVMLEEIRTFGKEKSSLQEVLLVALHEGLASAFEEAFCRVERKV